MRATRLGSAACAALVAVIGALVLPAVPAAAACTTSTAPLTVEEQRLESQPVPGQILARSGFDARVTAFAAALCATASYTQATQAVTTHAAQLWKGAVDRAQAGPPGGGQLAADDDRPLYWARLGMTRALRRWVPTYGLSAARRATLERTLERASRGINSSAFDGSAGRRLFVTGFDPFLLDDEIRRGNPSGVAALTLDGQAHRHRHAAGRRDHHGQPGPQRVRPGGVQRAPPFGRQHRRQQQRAGWWHVHRAPGLPRRRPWSGVPAYVAAAGGHAGGRRKPVPDQHQPIGVGDPRWRHRSAVPVRRADRRVDRGGRQRRRLPFE
jgi:hypothetical protein